MTQLTSAAFTLRRVRFITERSSMLVLQCCSSDDSVCGDEGAKTLFERHLQPKRRRIGGMASSFAGCIL